MGFGCENLESGNYSNFNDDICYITALGRVPATGDIAMYRLPMVAPDAGTFPLGQMFSGDREKQEGFNTFGKINSSSHGNEVVSEQTTSISLRADTVYNAMNPAILPSTVNRNTAMAMLEGSGLDDNNTYVEIISTSGARNICPVDVLPAKDLFYRDGYFVIDGRKKDATTGKPTFRSNPFIAKYNTTNICSSMELAIAPTADTDDDIVVRWAFVSSSNVQFAEGTDANNYTADCMFLSDRVHGLNLLYDGFSANEVDTVATSGADSIYKVNAEIIAYTAGGGAPLIAGTAGDIAIVVDTADDTVEIYKYSTAWSADAVTSTLGKGFVAYSSNVATKTLSGTVATAEDTSLTGTSTSFLTELSAGDLVVVAGEVLEIASVTSDTVAALTTASGTTASTLSAKYSTNGEVGFLTVGTAGITGDDTSNTTGIAIADTHNTAGDQYVIPAKSAITNDIDRTVFWENYTV